MKRKIFIRSFLISLISVLFVFCAGIGITYINNRTIISERLITETRLAAALLDSTEDFSALDIFKNEEECRITVISLSGEVLYDSDATEVLENHLDREEVASAIRGDGKTVERYSETFDCMMTYYATLTSLSDGQEVILRMAIWSAEINNYILSTLPFLFVTLILGALVAGLFAKRLSSSISKRITDVAVSLKSVNDGDYLPLKPSDGDIEFFNVYNEINELNEKTVAHIRSEENEREKLNAVLDNISQGIIALTTDFKVAFVNGSAARLFGVEIPIGSGLFDTSFPDVKLAERIKQAVGSSHARFEHVLGNRILIVEVVTPEGRTLKDQIGRIAILSDMTLEKTLAKQKEEFFANASHELKTPMTAMLGLSELALLKSRDETVKKELERIHKETKRLSELVSDMLKLSRLEALDMAQEMRVPVKIREIVSEVIAELSESIRAKGLSVEISGDAVVMADDKKIYELLQNLCSNAVNYNKENGCVSVILKEDGDTSVICVKDTGIGISDDNIPHLFERFYRVDKSRSKKTGGTGLGLAIVKHICALYQADISIKSQEAIGTEITVVFKK